MLEESKFTRGEQYPFFWLISFCDEFRTFSIDLENHLIRFSPHKDSQFLCGSKISGKYSFFPIILYKVSIFHPIRLLCTWYVIVFLYLNKRICITVEDYFKDEGSLKFCIYVKKIVIVYIFYFLL